MKTERVRHTFRAFTNRNYSLFFAGQSVSLVGTWMQRTGVSWLVYTMTHSTFMLGLTIFSAQFPSFIFSLYGGILSDRMDRHKILLFTQTASMIQALLLAILTLSNHHEIWQILGLSAVLGIINAFDVSARQPLIHLLVNEPADLPNAVALNSSMVNLARLIGPALSGIVLGKYGAGICFVFNAVSFLAVIISLLLMRLPPYQPPVLRKKIAAEMSEGWTYLKQTPAIGMILLMLGMVSLLVLPFDTLLPVFAREIYKGDAREFGYLYSFIGVGAIAGTLFLASLKPGAHLKSMLLGSTALLGVGLILFSHLRYFPLAMVFAVLSGFAVMMQNTICITIAQMEADSAMRGRVMSYVGLAYFGMLPLGSLLVGSVSQKIGAPDTVLLQGILALVVAACFYRYLKKEKFSPGITEKIEKAEGMVMQKV